MCVGDPPTMEDHIVVSIDPLVISATLQSPRDADAQLSSSEDSSSGIAVYSSAVHVVEVGGCDTSDDEHLVQTVECRICQEEDSLGNMDIPCACRGTMKFAHWRCVQLWCNEKGDTICEICHQPYKPSYSPYHPEVASNNIRTCWTISRAPLDLHDPQNLAIAALKHHVLEAEDDDYVYSSISGIAFFRFIGLTIITLLLLRLAALLFNTDVEKALANFSFTLFRAAAFVLPLYLMARTIRSILTRRQRQWFVWNQLAAPELAFMLHEGQHHGLQFATSPVPAFRL